jgi:hypothetical protein
MVEAFHSKGLELPDAEQKFDRADLVFYGVDHSGPTFEGRIFIGAKRGLKHGAGVDHPAYAGSFYVFGHTRCFGDEGHCMVPEDRDPFDYRLPHHLEPATQTVTVTEPIERLLAAGKTEARVTVFAHGPTGEALKALDFTRLRLLTYAG